MGITGFLIAYYSKMVVDFILLTYFSLYYSVVSFDLPNFHELFTEFKKDFLYTIHILLGIYGEYIGVELMTYFAALTHDIK